MKDTKLSRFQVIIRGVYTSSLPRQKPKYDMFNADRHNEALKEAKKDVEDILLICLYSASISAMLLQRM